MANWKEKVETEKAEAEKVKADNTPKSDEVKRADMAGQAATSPAEAVRMQEDPSGFTPPEVTAEGEDPPPDPGTPEPMLRCVVKAGTVLARSGQDESGKPKFKRFGIGEQVSLPASDVKALDYYVMQLK